MLLEWSVRPRVGFL